MFKKIAAVALAGAAVFTLSACESDAAVADKNISVAAENFEVQRRVVAVNLFTDEFLFEVEGRCSWQRDGNLLRATCKHGPDDFRRHDLFLGDNATAVVEQLDGIDVDTYRTRIILKPETIIPSYEVKSSLTDDDN